MYTYKIPMLAWYKELSVLLKCITYPSLLSDIELSNIDTVRELLSIRDEVLICPISHSAVGTLIDDICINNYFSFVITSAYCCVLFELCISQLLLFLCNCILCM